MTSCNQDVMNEEQLAICKMAEIPHKILVMSGKGGVGKTTVAVNLAYAFASTGKIVGIMDADMHGPNVALMTGIEGLPVHGEGGILSPIAAARHVKVLSIASFLPSADQPIVWRGPRKSAAIRQFLGQGDWSNVEVLVVDCPPGTGDEPMSVAQLIPDADGVVIVTSPQDVALLDSRKCVSFVREVNHRVLGIIENLSGFACPECGHKIDLFKTGGGEKAALELDVPFLGRIPITPKMVEAGDTGKPLVVKDPNDPAALALMEIARAMEKNWGDGSKAIAARQDEIQKQTSRSSNMHIAIAAEDDKGLDGQVSMHFGRCPYYVMAEVKDGKVIGSRVEKNEHFGNHQPGQMPVYIRDLGANVILAGGMGPRAVDMFHSFGIEVATGAVGNVGKVLDAYLRDEIKGIVPCEHDHPDSCGRH
jgi:ATP-binding protein involved in chromosome partitioning